MAEALRPFGWQALAVPPELNLAGRRPLIARFRPDILVFQQCRHPLNDAAFSFGLPYVVDTDDADFHLPVPGLPERLDRTVRGAAGVIAGSRYLRDWHAGNCPDAVVIWTGTPISDTPFPDHAAREAEHGRVSSWAQANPLSYAAELEFVIALENGLRARGSRHRLRLYGIDTAEQRQQITQRFSPDSELDLRPTLPYGAFLKSLREVSLGLSPIIAETPFSQGKSFGKILGYLDAGVPVISSDAADHALFFRPETGVVSNDPATWEEAALRLLGSAAARDRMARAAEAQFRERLSMTAAAARVDTCLRGLLAKGA